MVISDMYYQYDTYFRRPPPFSLESRPVLGLSAFRLSAGSQNNQFLALSAPISHIFALAFSTAVRRAECMIFAWQWSQFQFGGH